VPSCDTAGMVERSGRLTGKVCAVTGASGIAAVSARRFAEEGAAVLVISLLEDECRAVVASLDGEGHAWVAADVRDEQSTEAAFAACVERFGRLDGLFAVAGGSGRPLGDGVLHEVTLDAWNATLALNLTTGFLPAREATRHMLAAGCGGSIVVTSSTVALWPSRFFDIHAYAAAKAGMIGWARAAAGAYAANGIRFNVIAPGLTDTPMAKRAAADEPTMLWTKERQPLPAGMLDAVDHANAALYFLSDESRHVTGQVHAVDGGFGVT
jgi:NAD(P)-dependent dehydrogenase (short-subunit alcohol dehydrogenase family)